MFENANHGNRIKVAIDIAHKARSKTIFEGEIHKISFETMMMT